MTVPRISVLGELRVHGREVETIIRPRWTDGDLAAAADLEGRTVTITIEPADAPAPGSPLDYLAELKAALLSLTDAHDSQTDDERHRELRRCMSLANTASLSILAERARR
jgi:hypothetical protein